MICRKKPAPRYSKLKYPDLKMGDKGELVCQLQDFLSRHGSNIKIIGVYNIGTYSAVCAFQRKHELKVTGKVNKDTWTALLKVK